MLLAILLNEINHPLFRKASQVITTLPHFISWVIVYSVFFSIFSQRRLAESAFIHDGNEKSVVAYRP